MQLQLAVFTQKILEQRGLSGESAERFLSPSYERDVHDPLLFRDMAKAVGRILDAVSGGERIALFGDYDADGVPGTALLFEWFKKIDYHALEVYIPNRHTEDYGLSITALEELHTRGVTLVITIDCGITDRAEVARAKELGMDVIISDHHLPPLELPDSFAIINPKCEGETYPFTGLCGAGVAFKLVQALVRSEAYPITPGWEKWLLDLVAIGTVSDMVPLIDENRALVHFGLRVLKQSRREGIRALCASMKIRQQQLTEDDIGFMIAPRINSASRMSHASEAYALLTTENVAEAETIARHLDEKNRERKAAVEEILIRAEERSVSFAQDPVLLIGEAGWNLGVVGLAASRLAEEYTRPAFVWGVSEDGLLKGSCRSDGRISIVDLMREAGGEELFENFGGHEEAGGFTVRSGKEEDFPAALQSAYARCSKRAPVLPKAHDLEFSLDEVNIKTCEELSLLGPFGIGNPKPLFLFSNITLADVRTFGNGGIHLELVCKRSMGSPISAIGFFSRASRYGSLTLSAGERIDLTATLECSYFKGRPEARLRIVDVSLLT